MTQPIQNKNRPENKQRSSSKRKRTRPRPQQKNKSKRPVPAAKRPAPNAGRRPERPAVASGERKKDAVRGRPQRTRNPRRPPAAKPAQASRPPRGRVGQRTRRPLAESQRNGDSLRTLVRRSDVTIYQIAGVSPLKRIVFSTPQTRQLLNQPEAIGWQPTQWLKTGIVKMLQNLPKEQSFAGFDDRAVGVVHFLRGGLAFSLREALAEAYGMNRPLVSFMTSQRYRVKNQWVIKQDQYRKFSLPAVGNLFLADILATGSTIANGLDILLDTLRAEKKKLRNFVFVTIGSPRTEEILEKFHQKFKKEFGNTYQNTWVIYIEGRFGLAGRGKSPVISLAGTDLLRYPALLTPEFELSQFERTSYPLERCVIYDMGTKVFDNAVFLADLKGYWQKLMNQGSTLAEAYRERWPLRPASSPGALQQELKQVWPDVPEAVFAALQTARAKNWQHLEKQGKTRSSLIRVCHQRIKHLDKVSQ